MDNEIAGSGLQFGLVNKKSDVAGHRFICWSFASLVWFNFVRKQVTVQLLASQKELEIVAFQAPLVGEQPIHDHNEMVQILKIAIQNL